MQQPSTISNGTVFGLWPLSRSIPAVALLLVTLLVAIKPEASLGLGLLERIVFWSLHVGVALVALLLASAVLLPRVMTQLPLAVALLIAGLVGALGVVPVFFLLEHMLPDSLQAIENAPIDEFAARGLRQALLVETLQSVPITLLLWMTINLPLMAGAWNLRAGKADEAPTPPPAEAPPTQTQSSLAAEMACEAREAFVQRLPQAIGTEVLLISSDLHYLHVFTRGGKCMILGTLKEASEALAKEGMLVHRSHWVASAAVERIIKSEGRWFLALCNGAQIPVSRRRQAEVAGWVGQQAKVVSLVGARTP